MLAALERCSPWQNSWPALAGSSRLLLPRQHISTTQIPEIPGEHLPRLGTQVWAVPAAQREITGCIQGMLKQLCAGSFEGPASIAGPNSTAHSSALRHFGQTPWEGAGNTPPCHLVCSLCIQSMAVPMQQGCGTKLQLLHVQVIRAA